MQTPYAAAWYDASAPVLHDHRHDLLHAAGLVLALFVVLILNGRPIGAGDTRPTERAAASLVAEGDLDLDEYPEVTEPFAREVNGRRVSIYPVLSAVAAAPLFALAGLLFELDETGSALAGKLAASLFSALAGATLFLALRRWGWPPRRAAPAATVFVLGTTLWATSQSLWQHPLATWMLSLAVYMALRAVSREEDEVWAGRAGLPLSLAVAARHADVVLAGVLALGLAVRWPRRLPKLVLWGLPGVAFVLAYQWIYFGAPWRHGFSGRLADFDAPWTEGLAGLMVSPAKGLLVFTPVAVVALVGIGRAFRQGERWVSLTLGTGVLAHWAFTARWGEWHGGECFGPRLMTDAMAFLFVFLPDGLKLLPRVGAVLAAVSIGVQALGAFSYDYRWEYLHQRPSTDAREGLWSLTDGPLPFLLRERVVILAAPTLEEGKVRIREHREVPLGPRGDSVTFGANRLEVEGERTLLGDVHLRRAAHVEGDRLVLQRRWDGLGARVTAAGRTGAWVLEIEGEGQGPLYVGEETFWSRPVWTTHMVEGRFRVRHRYHYPESGGADVYVTVGRGGGRAELTRVALEPAG